MVKMQNNKKNRLANFIVAGILLLVFFGLIKAGYDYFSIETGNPGGSLFNNNTPGEEKLVKKEFFNSYKKFANALFAYFSRSTFWFGFAAAFVLYGWLIIRLFNRYFFMFKGAAYLDILLHPGALESIPHCLPVLGIYFLFFSSSSLDSIMMAAFLLVSMPFIYKMLEDVFIAAEKEGTVENYLNKRKKNLAIMVEFLKKRAARLVIIPILFLVLLMVYWDFLYASIAISADDASAPAVFFSNFNNEFFVNYPVKHNSLILFHIGLFVVIMFGILYFVSIAGGEKHE